MSHRKLIKYYFKVLDVFKVNKTTSKTKSNERSCTVFLVNTKHMKYIYVELLFQLSACIYLLAC